MARPRVFVSSTFYDLKHIRASLEVFIESLGYDAVLFEKGDISFHPDVPLDESCYREAQSADVFVLIIGGRYGSAASSNRGNAENSEQTYESITKKEFETAQSSDVPTFILLDSAVAAEYHTYLRNKDNDSITYAHVDSVAVFKLIESIFEKSHNNPVFNFERATQIESWLREQWAGLFRELLRTRSQQRQLAALSSQVQELQSINGTLKTYLEEVLGKVTPEKAPILIAEEQSRLQKEFLSIKLEGNTFHNYLSYSVGLDGAELINAFIVPNSFDELIKYFRDRATTHKTENAIKALDNSQQAQDSYNQARVMLGLKPLEFPLSRSKKSSMTASSSTWKLPSSATPTHPGTFHIDRSSPSSSEEGLTPAQRAILGLGGDE